MSALWESRPRRERVIMALLIGVLAVALYLWLVNSVYRARQQLGTTVSRLRAESNRLGRSAEEIVRLRAMRIAPPLPAAREGGFRLSVQAQINSAGLAGSLLRIETVDQNQVKIEFGAVPFDDWLAWVGNLQSQKIRLDASRIEALSTPGLVSVTATLVRAGQ